LMVTEEPTGPVIAELEAEGTTSLPNTGWEIITQEGQDGLLALVSDIQNPPEVYRLDYPFTVPTGVTTIYVFAEVDANHSGNDDSFWVKMNGSDQCVWNNLRRLDDGWQRSWVYDYQVDNQHPFAVTPGTNLLSFYPRENNASIIQRIEVTQLDDLLAKLKQQIFDIDELPAEQPVMLLILTQSGQPIYNENFIPSRFSKDESLLSGFISSINAFFKEVFETSGSIERIKHQDLTVLLKPCESILFCYVFKGQSYSAIKKLEEFTSLLYDKKTDIWNMLQNQIKVSVPLEEDKIKQIEEIIADVFQ